MAALASAASSALFTARLCWAATASFCSTESANACSCVLRPSACICAANIASSFVAYERAMAVMARRCAGSLRLQESGATDLTALNAAHESPAILILLWRQTAGAYDVECSWLGGSPCGTYAPAAPAHIGIGLSGDVSGGEGRNEGWTAPAHHAVVQLHVRRLWLQLRSQQ